MKKSKDIPSPTPRMLHLLDARHRFIPPVFLAIVAFFATAPLILGTRLLVSWDVFSLTAVMLSAIVLFVHDPYEVRRMARLQDSSATILFGLIVFAALVSLFTVGLLLASAKGLPKNLLFEHVAVSVAAVVFSWLLVHILFALRYAHLYYFNAREEKREKASGGVAFPGTVQPDYLDFAYFSFVIGMTCQVSDVQITSQVVRRLALLHGIISFCFNTAILAMFVNIVASLL